MLLKAYAKVNLVLKVLGKNDYNYHNLQMLNAKIDLYDQIDVKKNNKKNDLVKFRGLNQENIKDDLVLRCINIIKNYYNIDDCFDITITKQIPIGAGMGGGSCDVATIVKYLLRRYHIEEDLNQLIHLLKDQSADIPYCLTNKIAFVEGIGEKVSEIFVAIPDECILVNPHISISTKEVFEKVKNYSKPLTKDSLMKQIATKGYSIFNNDLEEAAFLFYPQLQEIKNNLSKIGHTVMSGSGSTMMVFGDDLASMYEQIKKIYPKYFIRKVKILKEKENGN